MAFHTDRKILPTKYEPQAAGPSGCGLCQTKPAGWSGSSSLQQSMECPKIDATEPEKVKQQIQDWTAAIEKVRAKRKAERQN